jgi:hypothetical protein
MVPERPLCEKHVGLGLRSNQPYSHADKGNANTRFGRLKALGAGLILIAVGILRMLGGVQVVTHGTGQPMFSWGLIAAGTVCIVSALVPVSWITTAARVPNRKGKSDRHSR